MRVVPIGMRRPNRAASGAAHMRTLHRMRQDATRCYSRARSGAAREAPVFSPSLHTAPSAIAPARWPRRPPVAVKGRHPVGPPPSAASSWVCALSSRLCALSGRLLNRLLNRLHDRLHNRLRAPQSAAPYDLACAAVRAVLAVILSILLICWEVAAFWGARALARLVTPLQEHRLWSERLRSAATYGEWLLAATRLDAIKGRSKWRDVDWSPDYDYELVQVRLEQLRRAHETGDLGALSFLLRTSLTRNFGGIDDERLFEQTLAGTKGLIEAFNGQLAQSIYLLAGDAETISDAAELKAKVDLFKGMRHSLGNTALLLSGGASLGIYHVGILKALFERDLLPRIIAGSSSGAIMAAIACCRAAEDWPAMLNFDGIHANFLEEATAPRAAALGPWGVLEGLRPWSRKLARFLKHGVVFDGHVLKESLRRNIGDITFLEAYGKTTRVLNVAVSSTSMYDMPRLLNYITAPHVLVWSAVVASCALPTLFESAPLLAKDHKGNIIPWHVTGDRWIDGSVENDLPMKRLAELFNVNHFIVSQVNPHVYPFLHTGTGHIASSSAGSSGAAPSARSTGGSRPAAAAIQPAAAGNAPRRFRSLRQKLLYLITSEVTYRLDQVAALGICQRTCQMIRSVLTQQYCGDITIVPELAWSDLAHMFVDRPLAAMRRAVRRGEVATWHKMSIIENHLAAELALDDVLLALRNRILHHTATAAALGGSNSTSASRPSPSEEVPREASDGEGEAPPLRGNSEAILNDADLMFDPNINVRRHISPSLSLPSLGATCRAATAGSSLDGGLAKAAAAHGGGATRPYDQPHLAPILMTAGRRLSLPRSGRSSPIDVCRGESPLHRMNRHPTG